MLGTILLSALLDSLSLGWFFTSAFVGLLVMIELTVPFDVSPEWRTRLRWVIVAALLGFAALVTKRIVDLMPPGVL